MVKKTENITSKYNSNLFDNKEKEIIEKIDIKVK